MATQNASLKEIMKIAIGELIVLVLMFAVFFLIGRFDLTVVWGGLLGTAANILYFVFICIGVNSAVNETEPKRQKQSLTISYYLRLLVLGILVAVASQILSKTGRDEQATFVTVAGIIVTLMMLISRIGELFDLIRSVFGM